MPSKRKRVASKQAQLSQRKQRRSGRGRNQAATQAAEDGAATPAPVRATSARPAPVAAPTAPRPAAARVPSMAASPRSRGGRAARMVRAQQEPLPMYGYLGSELKRIGALTGLIAVVLVVLTFVLR